MHIGTASPELRELYGQLLVWTGEPRRAIPVLERVLQTLPHRASAARALIDALRAVGRVDEAWHQAQDQLSHGAVSAPQQLSWAEVALEAGHAEDALHLAESLSAVPDVADRARIIVGRALLSLSQPANAREMLRATHAAEPDPTGVLALVDSIAATEGIKAALEESRRWQTRDPAWRDVIARRALWERLIGARASAEHLLAVVRSLDPHRATLLRAEIALAEWRPRDAERILTSLRGSYPDDTQALDLLSTALASQRRWDEALVLVRDLEARRPKETAWKIRRAEWVYHRAPSEFALLTLEALVERYPGRLDAQLALAGVYAQAGQPQQALELLGDTVTDWSTLPEPRRELAASLLRTLGRREEALAVPQAAPLFSLRFRMLRAELLTAERGPEAADAQFAALAHDPRAEASIFLVWAHVHDDTRSREILEQGWQRFPSDPVLTEELAVRRWAAGDAQGALDAADQVLAHDDSRSRAWFVKIEAFSQLQPDRDLDHVLERFEARFANEPSVMLAMADLLSSRSQIGDTRAVETALAWTERMWNGDYQETALLLTQARLYGALDRWGDALSVVDAILQAVPDSMTALKQRAALLSYMGRYEEAITAYETYLAKAPDDLATRRLLARVEGWRQAHEASLRRYTQLVEDVPAAKAVRTEAEAKRAFYEGEWTQAIAAYQRWLTLEPDEVEARFELAQSYDLARQPALAEQEYEELLSHLPLHRQAQVAHERLQRRRVLSAQPFVEGRSADGYQGQRLLELVDSGMRISDDLGAGLGTQFSLVGAVSRASAGRQQFTGRLVTAQASRPLGTAWRVSALGGGRSFPELGGTTAIAKAVLSWWPSDTWLVRTGVDRAPFHGESRDARRKYRLLWTVRHAHLQAHTRLAVHSAWSVG